MTLKSAIANSLILAIILVASVVAMEFTVRALFPVYDPSGQLEFRAGTNDVPTLGIPNKQFRQRKNTGDYDVSVTFNRYGLRDDKDLATSTPDDFFVVGDSFSIGWGVAAKDRYSNRLQALTGRRSFNISTPGDFDNYRDLINYAVKNGAPVKNLIVGVCMENDLADYDAAKSIGDKGVGFSLLTLKGWLTKKSALYVMATAVTHTTPALKDAAVRLGLITPNLAGVPQNRYSQNIVTSSVKRLVSLMAGMRATVLIIPSRSLWVGGQRKAADRTHKEFIKLAREAGLDIVDPRQRFEASGAPLSYHFDNDGHWNARGHAVAAKALSQFLKTRNKAERKK